MNMSDSNTGKTLGPCAEDIKYFFNKQIRKIYIYFLMDTKIHIDLSVNALRKLHLRTNLAYCEHGSSLYIRYVWYTRYTCVLLKDDTYIVQYHSMHCTYTIYVQYTVCIVHIIQYNTLLLYKMSNFCKVLHFAAHRTAPITRLQCGLAKNLCFFKILHYHTTFVYF